MIVLAIVVGQEVEHEPSPKTYSLVLQGRLQYFESGSKFSSWKMDETYGKLQE